jgi:hypothetical protein
VSKEGKAYKYDISIPLPKFKEVVDVTREHLRSKGLLHDKAVKHVIGYGHVGDGASIPFASLYAPVDSSSTGNLHLNIIADAYTPEITNALEPFVYEVVGKNLRRSQFISDYENQLFFFSLQQGFHFSRTWDRFDEDARPPLFKERGEHRVDEKNQAAV